jgi:signal transduction histidine kinase
MRAVNNLLKNAFDAVAGNGTIWVRSSVEDGCWLCRIEDNGPGIPKADNDKIFEPFYTTRNKGTGLGLAFVYQVVQAHNGQITVEKGIHGGAVFQILIALAEAE